MRKTSRIIAAVAFLLFVCIFISACGVTEQLKENMQDPVAEDYLTKMLDAIENEDVDAAYAMFAEGVLTRDSFETTMKGLNAIWDGGEYTYELISSGVNNYIGTGGKKTTKQRKYRVKTLESTYTVDINYRDDDGLVGFFLNLTTDAGGQSKL